MIRFNILSQFNLEKTRDQEICASIGISAASQHNKLLIFDLSAVWSRWYGLGEGVASHDE